MKAGRIIELFNTVFEQKYNTVLCGGANEPLYVPGGCDATEPSRLYFSFDFPRSALHEISHWCIAGSRRRKLVDFGYEYAPPPRLPAEQKQFFALELKTQTLEYIFCKAVRLKFSPSADNLRVNHETVTHYMQHIRDNATAWLHGGIKGDAGVFLEKLQSVNKVI